MRNYKWKPKLPNRDSNSRPIVCNTVGLLYVSFHTYIYVLVDTISIYQFLSFCNGSYIKFDVHISLSYNALQSYIGGCHEFRMDDHGRDS